MSIKTNLFRTTKEYIKNLTNTNWLTTKIKKELETKILFYKFPMAWETKLLRRLNKIKIDTLNV